MHFLENTNAVMVSHLVKILKHHATTIDDEQLKTRIKINKEKSINRISNLTFHGMFVTRAEILSPLITELLGVDTRLYIEALSEHCIKVKSKSLEKQYGIESKDCFYIETTAQNHPLKKSSTVKYRLLVQDDAVALSTFEDEISDAQASRILYSLLSERLVANHLYDLDELSALVVRDDKVYMYNCLQNAKKGATQYLMQCGQFSAEMQKRNDGSYRFHISFRGVDGCRMELPNAELKPPSKSSDMALYNSGEVVVINNQGKQIDKGVLSVVLLELNMLSKLLLGQIMKNSPDFTRRVLRGFYSGAC